MRLDDPLDREIVRRWASGERHTEVFAKVLAVDHLSLPAQTRAVKRTKDRLRVALRRMCKPATQPNVSAPSTGRGLSGSTAV